MGDTNDMQARCAEMLTTLAQEWHLAPERQAAYLRAILAYIPPHCTEGQLQRLILCYHHDHQEVQALSDPHDPGYHEAWNSWHRQVIRILRGAHLHWFADIAVDLEDLTQIALEELSTSIATYRFNSRFSTWAYVVIVRSGQHAIRERRAAKRTGTVISLDDPAAIVYPADRGTDPESQARAQELSDMIQAILIQAGGARWVEIFRLWAEEDLRLADIGRHVDLSQSRVSVLLDQMRKLLRQHPELIEWCRLAENGTAADLDYASQDDSTEDDTA